VAMLALAIAASLASLRILKNSPKLPWALLLASLIAVIALPEWPTQRLSAGLFRLRKPVAETFEGPDVFFANRQQTIERFYKDGPAATVSVLEYPRQDELIDRSIFSNGKSDGSTVHDYATMALAGLLPALLADKVERSFVIGYGTGVTVGEMAALDSVKEVVVAEISPAVIDAAPLFEYANMQAATNPKVKIIKSDAYRALLRSGGQFDVISSEPSNPWMVGVEMLYSQEFLIAARDRLSPGGVYAQWYHSYETDSRTIEMVMRTYASVFEHVAVWFAQGPDLLLLGFRNDQHAIDIERIEDRFNQPDLSAGFNRCGIKQFSTLLAHELLPLGVLHATSLPGPIHTLFHPRLSYLAARSFFAGGEGYLPMTAHIDAAEIGRRNSLVQRYIAAKGGSLSRSDRALMAEETCSHRPNECLALLGQWTHVAPNSRKLKRLQNNIVRKMVAANPELAGQVVLDSNVADVAALYAVVPAANDGSPPSGRESLAKASASGRNFQEFYHHAAPFSRAALAELWRRCEVDPKTRDECRKRRAELERRLGKL